MRITKEPEERKQEILDTAIKLFTEKGYEKTSIADIAKEINVAQGLCYRYFPSKEALFDSALDQYAERLVNQMREGLSSTQKTLHEIIAETPLLLENHRDPYYKVFHEETNEKMHNQLAMRICEKIVPIVKRLIEIAQENGEVSIPDIDSTASFCVYGQLGVLLNKNLSNEEKEKRIRNFLLYVLSL